MLPCEISRVCICLRECAIASSTHCVMFAATTVTCARMQSAVSCLDWKFQSGTGLELSITPAVHLPDLPP